MIKLKVKCKRCGKWFFSTHAGRMYCDKCKQKVVK